MTHSAGDDGTDKSDKSDNRGGDNDETLPPFSEQVAEQLGGVRGMVESGVPVVAFVLVNVIWSLTPALIASVALGIGIAIFRLTRKQSVRHAMNGLFGIAIGAFIAWRSGDPKTFYLPGILISAAYGVALIISVLARRPLVGWIWSLVADKGSKRWAEEGALRRTFGWLTLLWAATYLIKVLVNTLVWYDDGLTDDQKATILGIFKIALGFPPYALLAALTAWAARRTLRRMVTPQHAHQG